MPTAKGRIVSSFLEVYFPRWVDYQYTSAMEASLDQISAGAADRLDVLDGFWGELTAAIGKVQHVQARGQLLACTHSKANGSNMGRTCTPP